VFGGELMVGAGGAVSDEDPVAVGVITALLVRDVVAVDRALDSWDDEAAGVGVRGVVCAGALLELSSSCCARTPLGINDAAKKAERSSVRFSDICEDLIAAGMYCMPMLRKCRTKW